MFRDQEKKSLNFEKELAKSLALIDILKTELGSVKTKVMESEYAAFCLTLTTMSSLNPTNKKIQLIMRKNCNGESVLIFEDNLGHVKRVKAKLVSDIEPDLNDPRGIILKYKGERGFGKKVEEKYFTDFRFKVMGYMKNFMNNSVNDVVIGELAEEYPGFSVERNVLSDLKSLFIG